MRRSSAVWSGSTISWAYASLEGIGYIVGPRIASLMVAGVVLSYLVLIPAIKYFGTGLSAPLAPEASRLIKDVGVEDVQGAYVPAFTA